MKRFLIILSFFLFSGLMLHAQDDNANDFKIREKMTEFIQKRLNLSKNEAEKFSPIFLRYFNECRSALREFRGKPPLDLQQRIVELRLRYRNEFKEIIGEKRSNAVYEEQEVFIRKLIQVNQDRLQQRRENSGGRRFRATIQ